MFEGMSRYDSKVCEGDTNIYDYTAMIYIGTDICSYSD